MNDQGFTLIELLVTVSIVGILAAVSIANYSVFKDNAYNAELLSTKKNLESISELVVTAMLEADVTVGDTCSISYSPKNGTNANCSYPNLSTNIVEEILPSSQLKDRLTYNFQVTMASDRFGKNIIVNHCKISSGDNGLSTYYTENTEIVAFKVTNRSEC